MMIKKPWSISTTVRNPERLREFLSILKEFEGETFDVETQVNYFIKLIENKLYKPQRLPSELERYYDPQTPKSYEIAQKIWDFFLNNNSSIREDRGIRARTAVAPLTKLGFAVTKRKLGTVEITPFGQRFLQSDYNLEDTFLEAFFKWNLPNPLSDHKLEDGFNLNPFILVIKLIYLLNKKWYDKGNKPKGVSKSEFSYFVMSCINFKDIEEIVDQIIKLREKTMGKTQNEKKIIFDEYVREFVKEKYSNSGKKLNTILKNLKDYGDNAIRYLRTTGFFTIRGGGFYFDLEPRRDVEIKSILRSYDGSARFFGSIEDYRNYLNSYIEYPWETKEELIQIIKLLQSSIRELNENLKEKIDLRQNENMNLDNLEELSKEKLKSIVRNLRKYRISLFRTKSHDELQNTTTFKEFIDKLENIMKSEGRKPVELEYLTTMNLNGINDALYIKPNYPLGDDNKPINTAPGEVPDIECFYKDFNMVCEVTTLTSRNQWYAEGQPVMRHFREFEKENTNKENYCLFVAPRIHRDTYNQFNMSNMYGYEGQKQKIIPMSLSTFVDLLRRIQSIKYSGNEFRQEQLKAFLEQLYNTVTESHKVEEWSKKLKENLRDFDQIIRIQ